MGADVGDLRHAREAKAKVKVKGRARFGSRCERSQISSAMFCAVSDLTDGKVPFRSRHVAAALLEKQ